MLKRLSKLLITITMLFAFVGQTMAYHIVASDERVSAKKVKIYQQTVVNDKDEHSTLDDDCCDVECCENDCICPANTCATIAYLEDYRPLSEFVILGEALLSLATQSTRFIATSHYRPPIHTS